MMVIASLRCDPGDGNEWPSIRRTFTLMPFPGLVIRSEHETGADSLVVDSVVWDATTGDLECWLTYPGYDLDSLERAFRCLDGNRRGGPRFAPFDDESEAENSEASEEADAALIRTVVENAISALVALTSPGRAPVRVRLRYQRLDRVGFAAYCVGDLIGLRRVGIRPSDSRVEVMMSGREGADPIYLDQVEAVEIVGGLCEARRHAQSSQGGDDQ